MANTLDRRPSLHGSWLEACARFDAEDAAQLAPTPLASTLAAPTPPVPDTGAVGRTLR